MPRRITFLRQTTWMSRGAGRKRLVVAALGCLVVAALGLAIHFAPTQSASKSFGPRLVVVIVIDQFRYEYLQRFREHFVEGGFKRFLHEGATFTEAKYRHATTDTCPGHAVISTGTWGNLNGIVANAWFDTERGRAVNCVDSIWGGGSARNLLHPTTGDMLKKASDGGSRVITAAGKSAAAILLGGQAADAAYWTDAKGRFVTSVNYRLRLPGWAREFNSSGRVDAYFGKAWQRILPIEAYAALGRDDEPAERSANGLGRTFPHPMTGGASTIGPHFYRAFKTSPYQDEILVEFATAAIREEELGQDDVTDLIAVSFSANDAVGHSYGPDSHETLDIVVRTDRILMRLFEFLEREVGLNHTLIVLTADHGLAPLPEVAQARARLRRAGRVSENALIESASDALNVAYGQPESGTWVAFHDYPNLFLNEGALNAKGVRAADAERLVRRALQDVPGVQAAFTRTELEALRDTAVASELARAALLSFHSERSGHVVYRVLPFHVVNDTGTNHGSPWDYDTHVPLMWYGPGVKSGTYDMAVSPADIAPTLMALLGIAGPSGSAGRVLHEMLIPRG